MSISADEIQTIQRLATHLLSLTEGEIPRLIADGYILKDAFFSPVIADRFATFFAPFDSVNDSADVVLIGITPGKRQAIDALLTLRSALKNGKPVADAAARAKQVASFNGEMRDVAAVLMDYFRLNDVFGVEKSAMLFDKMAHRTHNTSVLRYSVLEWKTVNKKGSKTSGWFNYGGDDKIFKRPFMRKMIEEKLVPELQLFPNAWLVPFGPTPAFVLDELVRKGVIGGDRVLAGLNHPSGSQWNRHNCQMDRVDHSTCSPNVGCAKVQAARSD
jgi:hypothetical protein